VIDPENIFIALFFAGFMLFPAIYCRRVAIRKGLSPGYWFFAGLTRSFFAIASVHLAQTNLFLCPYCGEEFLRGQDECVACGETLPDAYSMTALVDPARRYDRTCPECATPYSLSDYRPDALEVRCSRCKALLERR